MNLAWKEMNKNKAKFMILIHTQKAEIPSNTAPALRGCLP